MKSNSKTVSVLFVSIAYPPDGVSTAQIVKELAMKLYDNGTKISVISTEPHYNVDDEKKVKSGDVRTMLFNCVSVADEEGIQVYRAKMGPKSNSAFGRLFQWLWFHIATVYLTLALRSRYDLIHTITPPPTISLSCVPSRYLFKKKLVLSIWELYPDILSKMNYLKINSVRYKLLQWLEKLTYKYSDAILPITNEMKSLIGPRILSTKSSSIVRTFPTFVDTSVFFPKSQSDAASTAGDLSEVLITYAGNIGPAQNFGNIVKLANILERHSIKFRVVGGGSGFEEMKLMSRNIGNIDVESYINYELMPEFYRSSTMSIVSLDSAIGTEALPSKTYKILASGTPILALCDKYSALHNLIGTNDLGITISDINSSKEIDSFLKLAKNSERLKEQSHKATNFIADTYSLSVLSDKHSTLYNELLENNDSA